MDNSYIKIIANSIINGIFCTDWHLMSNEELKHICSVLDYPSLEDRYICDNEHVYPYIHWDKLDKMQAIRIVSRNKKLLDKINLKKYTYKVKDIFFLLQSDYKLIFKFFDFDYNNLSQEDAHAIFCLGKDEFLKLIDITKYNFGFIEMMDIIRAYEYKRDVIEKLKYQILKNYQVTEILMNTGKESLDLFNIEMLNTLNWLDLLSQQPEFIYNCDFEKFIKGDPFNLIQLVVLFDKPDLTYLIDKIDMGDITAFGWEKLLIYKPEQFINHCDFNKLNENNWMEISLYRPELLSYKL